MECAFCIPIVILLMFGTLETCSGIFLRESLTVAAFEGARVGVRRRASANDVIAQVESVLVMRDVTNATIEVDPPDFSSLNALDPIQVTITAPTAGNSLFIFDSFVGRDISAQVTMVREFDD